MIEKVGHEKNYLTVMDALRFTKEHLLEEHWQPEITDRSPRTEWEKSGSKDIVQRAKEKIKQNLATHKVRPLEKDVEQGMIEIIEEKKKQKT